VGCHSKCRPLPKSRNIPSLAREETRSEEGTSSSPATMARPECNQAQDDAQTRKPTSTFLGLKKAAKKVAVAVVKTTKAAVVTPLHAAVAGGQKLSLQHGGAITRAREAKVMREMQAKKAKIQKEFEKLHRDLSDVEQKRAEAAAQAQASTAQAQQAERDRQRLEANSVQEQARYHELQREADALAKKQSRRKRAEEDEERRAAKFELKIRELKATSRAESTALVKRAEDAEKKRKMEEEKLRKEESARRVEICQRRDQLLCDKHSKVIALEAELAKINPETLHLQALVDLYQMKASASVFVASSLTALGAVCATVLVFGVPPISSVFFVCIEAAVLRQIDVKSFNQAQKQVKATSLLSLLLRRGRLVFKQARNQPLAVTMILVVMAVFAVWQFLKHVAISLGVIPVVAASALAICISRKFPFFAFDVLTIIATAAVAAVLAIAPAFLLLACIGFAWCRLAPPATGLWLIFREAESLSVKAAEESNSHLEMQLALKAKERKCLDFEMESIKAEANGELEELEDNFKRQSEELAKNTTRELKRCSDEIRRIACSLGERSIDHARSLRQFQPRHWTSSRSTQGYAVIPVDDAVLRSLQVIFDVDHQEDLGVGRDVPPGPWKCDDCSDKYLKLAAAWRIENHSLFNSYSAALDLVGRDVAKLEYIGCAKECCRSPLHDKLRGFRRIAREDNLRYDLNETFLLHGTKPETILSLLANGFNERFCGGLFGHGLYLAEDPAKNDQYATIDSAYQGRSTTDPLSDLHKTLYSSQYRHPGDVYYIILCRVVLGHYITTQDGQKDDSTGKSVWAVRDRELAAIPDTSPPIHYHALIAQSTRYLVANNLVSSSSGQRLDRYREFLQFNAQRTYPAYLLAYHRIKSGKKC